MMSMSPCTARHPTAQSRGAAFVFRARPRPRPRLRKPLPAPRLSKTSPERRYTQPVQRLLAFVYRFVVAALAGAQIFFSAFAAQAAFPREIAALPQGDPAR